ncbi:MAG: tRNA dihydrouridine synthase DusB [Candidatus Omnitrophota bacterium]
MKENRPRLKIGKLKLRSGLILAPMAGISDLSFRLFNRSFGCEFAFVEMINARSLSHKSRRTKVMLSVVAEDRPLGVQLLGCEGNFIKRALSVLRGYDFDVLDFNAACPAKKVTRRGEGAALLKEPAKLASILRLIVQESHVPVTLKIRIGWDRNSVNVRDIAVLAEQCGVKALFIHGRTKLQEYSGGVDYDAISSAKKAVAIPVIGSGDVLSGPLAKKMLDETGCDGLAIARGALGNPWIFKQIDEYLKTASIIPGPEAAEITEVMIRHLDSCIGFYGERNAVVIFRKFFAWYTKGLRKIRPLREKSSRVKTRDDMLHIINQIPYLGRHR